MADFLEGSPFGMSNPLPKETPFSAFGRLLSVRASGRHERGLLPEKAASSDQSACGSQGCGRNGKAFSQTAQAGFPMLMDLIEGPYLSIAMYLDAMGLCHADVACRSLRDFNRAHGGPWCTLGWRIFYGLELDGDSVFETASESRSLGTTCSRKHARVDWKGRYALFLSQVIMFRAPFGSADITDVQQPDEIAYLQCRLRTDLLAMSPDSSVYLEIEVLANPDNVSLAVVDFEDGGCSSVTFSPDTGAVIRERKVCESPRRVQGSYIQPLPTITPDLGFKGSLGLLLQGGHIAFYRRHAAHNKPETDAEPEESNPWESTGFVTDLSWAEGKRLTPCLAFRNEGRYRVSAVSVVSQPPLAPQRTTMAFDEASWSSLNWDVDQEVEDL